MLKSVDVYCTQCNYIKYDLFVEDEHYGSCPFCGNELKRAYTTFNFKLEYNPKKDVCGWANSNYESSQYWKDVKKVKDETGKTPNHKGSCDFSKEK